MSVESMAIVLHHSKAKGTAKLVLLGIANHDGDGGAWPAVTTLARYANVHERNVQRALEQLIGLGEIARDVQRGGTLDSHKHEWERPNRYRVLVACPAWCDRTPRHRPKPGFDRVDDELRQPDGEVLVQLPAQPDTVARLEPVDQAQQQRAPLPPPRQPRPSAPPPRELLEQTREAMRRR